MYKIYINNNPLIITQKKLNVKNINEINELNVKNLEKLVFKLENNLYPEGLIINCKNETEFLKRITAQFSTITAAGGIINNGKNKYLMIYRRGFWDLPKGKTDKKESIKDTAIREVIEETGLKKIEITQELPLTYHTYQINKKRILKKTYWYEMVAAGNQKLIPQIEEDIEDIKWFTLNEILCLRQQIFRSIWGLIEFYFLKIKR